MSKDNYITLMDYLAVLPDPRDRRGCWYEWNYLVTVVAAAMLAGYQTYADMNAWAARNGEELIRALSPKRKQIPSTSTLRRTVCGLDVVLLEEAVASYLQALDSDDLPEAFDWRNHSAVTPVKDQGTSPKYCLPKQNHHCLLLSLAW